MIKKLLILAFLCSAVIFYFLTYQTKAGNILENPLPPNKTPKVTLTPTRTPVFIDENSNLSKEIDKVSPEDFNNDFQKLKDKLNKL